MEELMLEPSKYLPFFIENREHLQSVVEVVGDILWVERIKFPEKRVGSIFIADSKKIMTGGFTTEVPEFFRVLYVGNGYYNPETEKDSPLDINQGDIIYTAAASVKIWSSFPMLEVSESDVLGETRHGDVRARFKSEEAFFKFLKDYNSSVKSELSKRIPTE